jgi:hypothetical protein
MATSSWSSYLPANLKKLLGFESTSTSPAPPATISRPGSGPSTGYGVSSQPSGTLQVGVGKAPAGATQAQMPQGYAQNWPAGPERPRQSWDDQMNQAGSFANAANAQNQQAWNQNNQPQAPTNIQELLESYGNLNNQANRVGAMDPNAALRDPYNQAANAVNEARNYNPYAMGQSALASVSQFDPYALGGQAIDVLSGMRNQIGAQNPGADFSEAMANLRNILGQSNTLANSDRSRIQNQIRNFSQQDATAPFADVNARLKQEQARLLGLDLGTNSADFNEPRNALRDLMSQTGSQANADRGKVDDILKMIMGQNPDAPFAGLPETLRGQLGTLEGMAQEDRAAITQIMNQIGGMSTANPELARELADQRAWTEEVKQKDFGPGSSDAAVKALMQRAGNLMSQGLVGVNASMANRGLSGGSMTNAQNLSNKNVLEAALPSIASTQLSYDQGNAEGRKAQAAAVDSLLGLRAGTAEKMGTAEFDRAKLMASLAETRMKPFESYAGASSNITGQLTDVARAMGEGRSRQSNDALAAVGMYPQISESAGRTQLGAAGGLTDIASQLASQNANAELGRSGQIGNVLQQLLASAGGASDNQSSLNSLIAQLTGQFPGITQGMQSTQLGATNQMSGIGQSIAGNRQAQNSLMAQLTGGMADVYGNMGAQDLSKQGLIANIYGNMDQAALGRLGQITGASQNYGQIGGQMDSNSLNQQKLIGDLLGNAGSLGRDIGAFRQGDADMEQRRRALQAQIADAMGRNYGVGLQGAQKFGDQQQQGYETDAQNYSTAIGGRMFEQMMQEMYGQKYGAGVQPPQQPYGPPPPDALQTLPDFPAPYGQAAPGGGGASWDAPLPVSRTSQAQQITEPGASWLDQLREMLFRGSR